MANYDPSMGMPSWLNFNQYPGAPQPQQGTPTGPGSPNFGPGMQPPAMANPSAAGALNALPPGMRTQQNVTNFDRAQAEAMLALHGQRNQMASVDRSRKIADQLRADAAQQREGKMVGRVYAGPRWYNALASVGADAAAAYGDTQASKKSDELDARYKADMQKFIDTYGKKREDILNS